MAIVKIWKVEDSLKRVLQYTSNPSKTENKDFEHLNHELNYIKNDMKTYKQSFVSGVNCDPSTAYKEMIATKIQYQKTGGILCFHATQSFKPNEITPDKAHQIGLEFAHEMWGERFEVTVSTHVDRKHIHNHFIINSVSFADGLRYYDNKKNYRKMRELNDELCEKYQLSVIKKPKRKSKSYGEWIAEKNRKPTIRSLICDDIDQAIIQSVTFTQFLHYLKEKGYLIKSNVKHMSISPPYSNKFFRLENLSDDNRYNVEAIKQRILDHKIKKQKRAQSKPTKMNYKGDFSRARRFTGIRATYIRYGFAMGAIPKNAPNKQVHFLVKQDWIHIDKISQEVILMSRKHINTMDDLMRCKKDTEVVLTLLIEKRKKLYNKLRRCSDIEQISKYRKDIADTSEQIRILRKEVVLYEGIEMRSQEMKQKLNVMKTEKAKEREKNECKW